jgi:hypothetical protein
MKNNIFDFFNSVNEDYTIDEIAFACSVNRGTVNRWIELKSVPTQYYFDLCRMCGIEIDYTKHSVKDKDQFFTSRENAEYCIKKTHEVLKNWNVDISKYHFIEPSAGDGSFYNLLPLNKRTGLDIEPKSNGIEKTDFLSWYPKTSNNICIGNPPFGLRGHLALKFINHATKFSDFVCFILPQLFNSNGKGSCKNRVKGLSLIHSEIINSDFSYPDGMVVKVNCIFQIWSKFHKVKEKKINLDNDIKIYSLSDGGTPGSTRNKKYLNTCDYYLPSTCFGKDKMKLYYDFEELPQRRGYGIIVLSNKIKSIIEKTNWSEVSFISTNGAYNLRVDLIEKGIVNKKVLYRG